MLCKSISEAMEQVSPTEIKERFDLDNRLSNCDMKWKRKHAGFYAGKQGSKGLRVMMLSQAPV